MFAAEQRLAFACCLDGSLLAIAMQNNNYSGGSLMLKLAWQRHLGTPMFVPATVHGGCVIAAAVDGSITALSCSDGSQLWRTDVASAVFAPPLLVLPPAGRQEVLLVGTQAGQVAALDPSSGQQLAAVELGSKVTGMAQLQRQSQLIAVTLAPGVVALLDLGRLLDSRGSTAGAGRCIWDAVQLPGDVFAPPTVGSGGGIAVGCRDDHLYFLDCSHHL
jgi:outer membrane protein assembly factor BamB